MDKYGRRGDGLAPAPMVAVPDGAGLIVQRTHRRSLAERDAPC